MEKILEPIKIEDSWSSKLQDFLIAFFHANIYDELFLIIASPLEVQNSKTGATSEALRKGKITFAAGEFRGEFSAAVSAELKSMGAVWIATKKVFKLAQTEMPINLWLDIVSVIAGEQRTVARVFEAISRVEDVVGKMASSLSLEKEYNQALAGIDSKLRLSLAKAVGVAPELSPSEKQKLLHDYTENVTKSIKDFAADETVRLRQAVELHVTEGKPRSNLINLVSARFNVSQQRAEFIAKQETRLFTSAVKQIQYKAVSSDKYVWSSIKDSRCRSEHKDANGKVFYWDQSRNANPVRNVYGMPVHPQEDFGCRCVAKPIVEVI